MNIGLKIVIDINKYKKSLIAEAKKKGLYENFGQKEVNKLEDLYYSSFNDRRIWNLISKFNDWCMNFNDRDLRGL